MNMKKSVGALGLAAALSLGAMGTTNAAYDPGRIFFECNSETFYANNFLYYPESFNGMKNYFKDYENILLVGHDPNWFAGEEMEYVIYGPGGLVCSREFTEPNNSGWETVSRSIDMMQYLKDSPNGGDGNYRMLWYDKPYGPNYDYQLDGESDFNISP